MSTRFHQLRPAAIALGLFVLVSPAQAVTCEETRGLSATELGYWAKRLQVSPAYLAALLEKAFCEVGSKPERVAADSRKRSPVKSTASPLPD